MTRKPKPGDPRTAVAYLRVSTREQKLGPEAQRRAIEQWASQHSVVVASWHADQGVSGASPIEKRPALLEAISALGTHGAGMLVVAKRDRLGRDVALVLAIESLAGKAGARVISTSGEGTDIRADHDDPNAELHRGITDVFAAHERNMIRHRTRAALAVKRSRGERVGHIPLGMRVAPLPLHPLTKRPYVLEPDPIEQATIELIRTMADNGASQRTIASKVVNPRTGKPFSQPSICLLLRR